MRRRVGDPASKYAYQPELLEKDLAEKEKLRHKTGQTIGEHIRQAVYYSGLQPETGMQIVLDEVRKAYEKLTDQGGVSMKIDRSVIDSTEELAVCMRDAFDKMAEKIESLEEELREKDRDLDDLLHIEGECGRLGLENDSLKKRLEALEEEIKKLKEDAHADGNRLDTGSGPLHPSE